MDMATYMKRRRKKRRDSLINRLGGECVDCGKAYDLEFDHKNRDDVEFRLSGKSLDKPWKLLKIESDKCSLRCSACHQKKTSLEVMAQHGTISRYCHRKHPCRCDLCKEAQSKWKKAYRQKRKTLGLPY